MNEEELRLLRAAVGNLTDDNDLNADAVPTIAIAQPADTIIADIGNLREEDLDNLLSQLQESLSQQPEPVPVAVPIPQGNSNTEFHFDQGLLEQILDALARGDGAAAAKGENNFAIQQAFETFSRSRHDDNSQNSTPTPEPPNHMLQQRQEQAGILISNEIYRQRNGEVPENDDPEKAAERERVREENRERKKRWREVNQDRSECGDTPSNVIDF